MKSAWLGLLAIGVLGTGAFAGCGGSSRGDDASSGASGVGIGGSSSGGSSGGGSSSGGSAVSHGGEPSLEGCEKEECGPQLGLPNWTCADGNIGGPTGRCIRQPSGSCGWEVNDCPPAGEGGGSSHGGQGNTAGAFGAGGAATDECGGCDRSASEICVYQVGGPGPSRYVCATQNPCGAPGACACIVGQGSCQPELMGEPPGYCSCDNGLD